ncbi:MAG: alpha/beta fold hydrolase [Pseudomonadota bacterium]
MKLLKWLLIGFAVLLLVVPLVGGLGYYLSLDHERAYAREVSALPAFDPGRSAGDEAVLSTLAVGGDQFRLRSAGFGGSAGNVLLLHGFPETSIMYEAMIPVLAQAGFQVVAFDQRGYSPGARPESVASYATDALVADVYAVADAVGFERFHLVGHDWGAAVGWRAVIAGSPRLVSWSALSIPHLGAYGQAIASDPDQQSRSGYLKLFATPWVPEVLFGFNGFAMLGSSIYSEHGDAARAEYLALFREPGALTAALNWYRASAAETNGLPLQASLAPVRLPTAFIWGSHDPVVGAAALSAQRELFDGNLWETELDAGHWLMENAPQAVTEAVLAHLDRAR